jgi:hypothetical protein
MLGNRSELEKRKARIQIESLRYLRENDPEAFQKAKEDLEGTDLWQLFQKEYGQ